MVVGVCGAVGVSLSPAGGGARVIVPTAPYILSSAGIAVFFLLFLIFVNGRRRIVQYLCSQRQGSPYHVPEFSQRLAKRKTDPVSPKSLSVVLGRAAGSSGNGRLSLLCISTLAKLSIRVWVSASTLHPDPFGGGYCTHSSSVAGRSISVTSYL